MCFSYNRKPGDKSFFHSFNLLSVLLISVLLLRGGILEVGELVDPTETRYATIAQNMVLSGDWVTPQLQTENGIEPYLSKPPLHYWLTALSYTIFGFEEWTSRLPSFLGLLLIVSSIMIFARRFFDSELGLLASLICVTSPIVYFLAGSSTIDVTFAAFITAALVAFAVAVQNATESHRSLLSGTLFFVFAGLAFMTKGPAGLVLIGLPIFSLCLFDRSMRCLLALPWLIGSLVFLAIAVPWFCLIEQRVPGSVWYFFIHENFLRFLIKEYGGRHGDAHIQPHGTIWLMMLVSMLPWTFYVLHALYRKWIQERKLKIISVDRWMFFCFACGLSPLVFFTVARSILPAYVLPGIPGLSLFFASILRRRSPVLTHQRNWESSCNTYPGWKSPSIASTAFAMSLVMTVGWLVVIPFVDSNKSAALLLEFIADESRQSKPIVAVVSAHNYSPFWTSGAHENELSKPIQIEYANEAELVAAKYENIIVRESSDSTFSSENSNQYTRVTSRGKWFWYRRNSADHLLSIE